MAEYLDIDADNPPCFFGFCSAFFRPKALQDDSMQKINHILAEKVDGSTAGSQA